MKLKPHLVLRHALAGKTRPIDRLPAFLDMPFGGAALVVEPNDSVRLHSTLVTTKPIFGNKSPGCRSTLATTRRGLSRDAA